MLFTKPWHDFKIGDVVRSVTAAHDLEVSYIKTFWFKPDEINVLHYDVNGKGQCICGLEEGSLRKV